MDVLNIEHPKAQEQAAILTYEVGSGFKKSLLSGAMIAMLAGSIGITVTQTAWAKNLPMGHPSLILTLRAGDDSRFDFFVVDDESINTLEDEIAIKLYGIIEKIVLPEIKKQFDEKKEVFSSGYIEYISVNYRVDESRLEILIARQPEEYGCDTEGCHVRIVDVDVPTELELSQIRQVGMFVAVYETPDRQLVDRIPAKTLDESRILLSEASAVLEEKENELMADKTPIESFYLRQYEDISRVTILFSPFDPGGTAKEPIDVVDTSNTYYKRIHPSTTDPENQFKIWASDSVTSTAWNSYIHGTICPNPIPDTGREEEYDPETGALMDPGSDVEITYYAITPDGIERPIDTSLYYSTTDFCSDAPGAYLAPDVEGDWMVYGTVKWVSEGVIREIQSNEVYVLVNAPLYNSANSETLDLDAHNYPLLKLLDWSSDGTSILVAYDNTYNASIGIDPRTTPSIETGVLGIMDPDGHKIRPLDLPAEFRYFTDARFSPSNDNVLLILGSAYEFENQTVFKYDLQNSKLVPLPNINGYPIWVPDKDGDDNDDIVFGREIREDSDKDRLKTFEIWLADFNGTIVEKLYQQSVNDEAGFRLDDSSADGSKILITVHKQSEFPININDLAIFDMQTRKLDTILSSTNTALARFAPFSGLVLYNIGSGYKTPAGPLSIMTIDISYHEELSVGERAGTEDSPATFVTSPDGKVLVAAVQEWGSGEQYITKTQLAQPIPEFGSYFITLLVASILTVTIVLAKCSAANKQIIRQS